MDEEERASIYQEMQTMVDNADIAVWVTHGVKTPTWNNDYEVTLTPDGGVLSWLIKPKSN
jgi:peptide/nickel transport system substrate-binding protein